MPHWCRIWPRSRRHLVLRTQTQRGHLVLRLTADHNWNWFGDCNCNHWINACLSVARTESWWCHLQLIRVCSLRIVLCVWKFGYSTCTLLSCIASLGTTHRKDTITRLLFYERLLIDVLNKTITLQFLSMKPVHSWWTGIKQANSFIVGQNTQNACCILVITLCRGRNASVKGY